MGLHGTHEEWMDKDWLQMEGKVSGRGTLSHCEN